MSWWFSTWHFGVQTHLGDAATGSQCGLGATYWVLSLPKLMQSSSLFLQEVWFFQVFPMFLSTCFLYLFCTMFRSPDLPEALPSRMGMLGAPPHHVPGILGQFGTAWTAWDGFGKVVGPCRTSKWKTLKTVQGTRCYCSVQNIEQEPSTNLQQIYLLDGRLLNALHRLDSSIFPGKMSNLPWSKLKLATAQFKSRLAHLRKPTWD